MRTLWRVLLLSWICGTGAAWAAVGCTLSNPAEDLKILYPELSSYKEEVKDLTKLPDGQKVFASLKARLGSDLDPVYEAYDTPYTLYTVFKGDKVLGLVHGVNVPGLGGVIQIFVSADPQTGEIRRVFFQRIESPAARALKKKEFLAQFAGLTLADFYKHDYYAVADPKTEKDKIGRIENPVTDAAAKPDFAATLRGLRKDLILLDIFAYGRRNEPFYEKAQEGLAKLKGAAPK